MCLAICNHAEQATTGILVFLEVIGQFDDSFCENRNLHFRRAGVICMYAGIFDDFRLLSDAKHCCSTIACISYKYKDVLHEAYSRRHFWYNIMMSHNINSLKQQFLEYIEIEKGRAVKTVENYDHYLTRFIEQSKIKQASDISETVIREFRLWLNRQVTGNNRATGDTLKKKTQNYYMIAIRAFLKYLAKCFYLPV